VSLRLRRPPVQSPPVQLPPVRRPLVWRLPIPRLSIRRLPIWRWQIRRLPIRRLIGPALMTVVMLLVLLGLGTWQVRRLAWKDAILAQIARAEAAPPVPLLPTPAGPAPAQFTPAPFTKVAVTGTLLHDKSALFGAEVRDTRAGPELGAFLIEPLQRDGALPLLIDRGWVPIKRTSPVAMPQGTVTIAGYVHQADTPGLFSAHDDVAGRHFYTLNPTAIGAALGLDRVAPFILIALVPPPAPGMSPGASRGTSPGASVNFPIPAEHLPRPPNNHLTYAITWYGLAVALVVIFTVWARKAAST
jgi:surfeit locus 1 family protein